MRNELPGYLTDFRAAIQYWTSLNCYAPDKVRIITELYQGSNPLLPDESQFTDGPDVSAGVCDGVAVTWINKNLLGQGEQFHEYAESNWDVFAEKQISIRLAKQVFKTMRQRLAQEKKAVNIPAPGSLHRKADPRNLSPQGLSLGQTPL